MSKHCFEKQPFTSLSSLFRKIVATDADNDSVLRSAKAYMNGMEALAVEAKMNQESDIVLRNNHIKKAFKCVLNEHFEWVHPVYCQSKVNKDDAVYKSD